MFNGNYIIDFKYVYNGIGGGRGLIINFEEKKLFFLFLCNNAAILSK